MEAPTGNTRPQVGDLHLADAMVRMAHVTRRAFADISREHGLTPVQAELLCVLTSGQTQMTQLSHILGIEKSGLSGLVDRAARRGLVRRVRHPGDRRCYDVELTPEGARVASACHDDITRRLETLARDLPAPDRTQLTSSMAQLLAAHEAGRRERDHHRAID